LGLKDLTAPQPSLSGLLHLNSYTSYYQQEVNLDFDLYLPFFPFPGPHGGTSANLLYKAKARTNTMQSFIFFGLNAYLFTLLLKRETSLLSTPNYTRHNFFPLPDFSYTRTDLLKIGKFPLPFFCISKSNSFINNIHLLIMIITFFSLEQFFPS